MRRALLFCFILGISVSGFAASDSTSISITVTNNNVDWCNLQYPESATIPVGESFTVYAQVYEAGVTDAAGQGEDIAAWIGYSDSDSDPSGAGWTWVSANYYTDNGNNDEYQVDLGTAINDTGTYYYASRFSRDSITYKYGGYNLEGGGFWDGSTNVSGTLEINENQPPVLNAIANQTLTEDIADTLSIGATDPEGDDITFSVSGGSESTVMATISTDSLFLTPAENYNTTTPIIFQVIAEDANGLRDTVEFEVTVTAVNDAPVISSLDDQTGEEGQQLTFTVSATDADDDALTWSSQNLPEGAQFTDNGDGSADFGWTPTFTQSGVYSGIEFIVDDGQGGASRVRVDIPAGNRTRELK